MKNVVGFSKKKENWVTDRRDCENLVYSERVDKCEIKIINPFST